MISIHIYIYIHIHIHIRICIQKDLQFPVKRHQRPIPLPARRFHPTPEDGAVEHSFNV